MTAPLRTQAAAMALVFLALHLPFLPASFEDLDSLNFALGIRDFDVGRHQPHPPGYPVFIAAAKGVATLAGSELRALAWVSVAAGTLAVLAIALLAGALQGTRQSQVVFAATALAATAPLFWVTAARPLSDMAGLAAALAAQAALLNARTERGLAAASLAAAFGAGVRSQVVWLTVPLGLLVIARWPAAGRWRAAAAAALGYAAGAAAWFVPMVIASGGLTAYGQALATQGSEDFTGVAMLWTTPTPRQLVSALLQTFVAPWASVPMAVAVLLAATAGAIGLRREPRALASLAVAFGPYLVFHLLFQETATTRYALPVVVPMACLAAHALWPGADGPSPAPRWLRPARGMAVVVLVGLNLVAGHRALIGYSSEPAPAFAMLAAMRAEDGSRPSRPDPVLAMHRRGAFDFRRPLLWESQRLPRFADRLESPPKHEWLALVDYWNGGGRNPVWFIADPPRSDLALVDHDLPRAYRWRPGLAGLLGGARPNEVDWYTLDRPGWYLGEGWALTPESAGVAREDGRGPGVAPVQGWIRRRESALSLMVGGRNFAADGSSARLVVAIDGRAVEAFSVEPGFFLRMIRLDRGALDGAGDYATLTVAATSDAGRAVVAIEQFDAQPPDRPVLGFGEGWHELEYNPATGALWRWTSDRSTLHLAIEPGRDVVLHLQGEADPSADAPRLTVRAGEHVLADQAFASRFDVQITVPAGVLAAAGGAVTLETPDTHVPAETSWRPSPDQRRLGLKVLKWRATPVS